MDLKWFHLVFIAISIALVAGMFAWAVGASQWGMAATALVAGVALIVYERYFVRKTRNMDTR
jgi:uncharacterized membrane protein